MTDLGGLDVQIDERNFEEELRVTSEGWDNEPNSANVATQGFYNSPLTAKRSRNSVSHSDRPALRVLHLAFEDHRRPGSGGGALRSREINTRLARTHEITAVVAKYKGARTRVEDGVSYKPIGLALGHFGSMITYHLALPWFLLRNRADLVIEDFAPPHSSSLVPLWTSCPTLAIVQYFFAAEKSLEYHLPFRLFEIIGTKLHQRFIVVSESFIDPIRAVNQHAIIDVVYAGVSPLAAAEPEERSGLLFLGRLEFGMKGLDLLVEAFAEILSDWPETRLRIAGDGPDRRRFERLLNERGLEDKVDLLGRLEGNMKWDALRRADVVLMPSRYETFGLVALEAMSVGTPTVAFAIPSLRDLVGGTNSAVLVEPEDGIGLGRAVSALLSSPERRRQISAAGRLRATAFDWDEAAREHDRIYRIAASDTIDRSARARLRRLFSATDEFARDRLHHRQHARGRRNL